MSTLSAVLRVAANEAHLAVAGHPGPTLATTVATGLGVAVLPTTRPVALLRAANPAIDLAADYFVAASTD